MTKPRAKKKKGDYTVFLTVNGTQLSATSVSLDEALNLLPKFTPKTKGSMVIAHGSKQSKPIPFAIPALKRLFYPGMTGQVNRTALAKRYAFFS